MVEAYLRQYRQPSLRQVFDAAALSKNTEEEETWRSGESSGGLPTEVLTRLPLAFELVKGIAAQPRYNDAHCWIFTPASFLDAAEALFSLGCFPYVIDRLFPTEPGAIEFQVRLKAAADAADPSITRSIAAARGALPADGQQAATSKPLADGVKNQALQHSLAALQRENDSLRAAMAEIQQSTSWRITAPLRSVKQIILGRR
jgi:hypothetical protein